jgi:tetratricopeptide (TPR) repeat protein
MKSAAMLSLFVLTAQGLQTPPSPGNEQRWKVQHEAGVVATEQGFYSQAVQSFQAAIVEAEKFGLADPRLAQSLSGLATVHRLRESYAEAVALSRRSLAILEKTYGTQHPNVAIGQNNLAMILRLHGNYEEARILSEQSLTILEKVLGPEHVNVAISLNNLVLAYLPQKKYAEAEPFARRSLSIFERTPEAGASNLLQSLESLAEVCRKLSNYDESERLYRRVLSVRWGGGADIAPVLDKFANMLNLAFFEVYRKEAQEAFRAAPGWSGVSADLYIAMVRALRDRGLTEEPEALIRRAIQAFPNSLEARYELAQVYAETHRYQAALDTLGQAANAPIQGSVDPARNRYLRSLIYEEIARMHGFLFQFDEALSNLKTALQLDPGNAHGFVALGDLYLKLDRPEDAAAQYAQAILVTGSNATAYYGIAEVNRRMGRYPQAVMAADKALEINSGDTKSSYVRSVALLRGGRREEGEIELERYRKLEAKDHDEGVRGRTIPVTLHTAAAKLENHEDEEALEVLREAIRSYPDSVSLQLNLAIIQSLLGRHRDAIKTLQGIIDQGLQNQDYFLVQLNLSREYEILGDTKASQLHRLIYLQNYDAFLKNKRK